MATRKNGAAPTRGPAQRGDPRVASRGEQPAQDELVLRLYVAGTTPRSTRAIVDARSFCETHLAGRYRLEVIDIWQRPALAREEQIIAVPTLVRRHPGPTKKLVGDLSDAARVMAGLELQGDP